MAKGPLFLTRSAFIAVIVHVVVFALFIIGFQMKPKSSQAVVDPINIVKAKVIDGAEIEQEKKKIRDEQQTRERKKREEKQRKQREAEEEKKQQQEAEKLKEEKRQAEVTKAKEEKRVAEDKAKKESEAREKAELATKKAEEDKKKAEQEQIKAEETVKKLAQKLKKQEEEKRRAEQVAEQKRLDAILEQEDADMRAEQERQQQRKKQQVLNTLLSQYQNAIQLKVQNSWRKPPGEDVSGLVCTVLVTQAVGGYVKDVLIENCNGGSVQFRKSVEEAVRKADPLPAPSDDKLFDRQVRISFKPN